MVIGDKLGLYQALAAGPATSAELAHRTSTHPRLVTEWLAAQAASGYVSYDPDGERFSLSPKQAFALAHEDGPMYLPGAFQVMVAAVKDEPKVTEAFRSGAGVGWHEHDPDLFAGTERFFRSIESHLQGPVGASGSLLPRASLGAGALATVTIAALNRPDAGGWAGRPRCPEDQALSSARARRLSTLPSLDGGRRVHPAAPITTQLEKRGVVDMARPLVHRMVHIQDRPGFQGGSDWACPLCPHQVVYYPLHHKVMVKGQAEILHVRAMEEVPVHLDDVVLELTEADENWLTVNAIAWSDMLAR